jgi:beta-galactosidase
MPNLTRREVLRSGIGVSGAAMLSRSAFARVHDVLQAVESDAALPAIAPREKLLADFGWKFKLGNADDFVKDLNFGKDQGDFAKTGEFDFAKAGFDDSAWRSLNLPHDWAVELPFVWDDDLKSHGYKPLGRKYPASSVGWYRRSFDLPASDAGRRIS